MKKINLEQVAVMGLDGMVDVDATMLKLHPMVMEFAEAEAANTARVSAAVNSVFDKYVGRSIKMNDLESLVTATMEVDPDNFTGLVNSVRSYVKTSSAFKVVAGRGAGVRRVCDIPAE